MHGRFPSIQLKKKVIKTRESNDENGTENFNILIIYTYMFNFHQSNRAL